MFTRPDLDDGAIIDALHFRWSFNATHIEYAPVGFGSHHWHVSDGQNRRFVTIDDLHAKHHGRTVDAARHRPTSALASAARLRSADLDFVVAPLPTIDAAITFDLSDRYVMAVYPHLDGDQRDYGPYATQAERLAVLERTGASIDPDAIELYRLCWDLSEVGIYISEFRQPHTTTDDILTAWDNLQVFLDSTRW